MSEFQQVLISMILVGVRYFIRGVDDDGHVANFVETEQMMIHQDYRASFVQVTVPGSYKCNQTFYPMCEVHGSKVSAYSTCH